MSNVNKKRLMEMMRFLYTMTDENHRVSTQELMEHLEEKNLGTNRKTLRQDIELLNEEGFDIVTVSSSHNMYYWGSRLFDNNELKILIDAVALSGFVTAEENEKISEKLISMASSRQRQRLNRHLYAMDRVKKDSNELLAILDKINDAISAGRKISFQRYDYNGFKRKRLKNFGEIHVVSPYVLYWNDEHYYMAGYFDKKQELQAFRVDRLINVQILEENSVPCPDNLDPLEYCRRMFEREKEDLTRVEMECENGAMKHVIDKFGEDVETDINSFETFLAYVDVNLERSFFSWIFQFDEQVKIIGPQRAVELYEKMVRGAAERL